MEAMDTAGNAALATTAGEDPSKQKKKRVLQRHKPLRVACSAAVNQLKQANKKSSVKAKEEQHATVDTKEDGEEEDTKGGTK